MRPFSDLSRPGARDDKGVEWWACDPYPTWYRWDDGKLRTRSTTPSEAIRSLTDLDNEPGDA